jgi:hypothetical protein
MQYVKLFNKLIMVHLFYEIVQHIQIIMLFLLKYQNLLMIQISLIILLKKLLIMIIQRIVLKEQ